MPSASLYNVLPHSDWLGRATQPIIHYFILLHRHLISVLEPHHEIPSRTLLTATVISSMYNNVKEKVIEGLSSAH